MKNFALVVAVVASMALSYWVGSTYSRARTDLRQNLCLTNQALVNILYKSIKGVTPKEVQADPKAYERGRRLAAYYIKQFEQAAPCAIDVALPPDPLHN